MPPERGTIIGRALWKPRYVVFGSGASLRTQTNIPADTSSKTNTSRKGPKPASTKPSLVDLTQKFQEGQEKELYVSIYKAKGDSEYLVQHSLYTFNVCEIRNIQHRKQSPSLPTLVIEFKPDSSSEKQRKRRSSRTPGLSTKDPWANVLLFRTVPEERYNIYDWQTALKQNLKNNEPDDSPQSPSSPSFQPFTNPFGPRGSKFSSSAASRPEASRTSSSQYTSSYSRGTRDPGDKDRTALISPSPSLRSRRSDLSSQASSQHPPMGFTHNPNFITTLPSDMPSPASTYDTPFIEGWTSAQGRSSALSSHTRASNSIASAVAPTVPVASSPPGPRETILDRAFQMKYIPGSDLTEEKEEEKVSSIARFEALMREVDEKKKQRSDLDSTQGNLGFNEKEEDESDSGSDDDEPRNLGMSGHDIPISTPAQRALEYISGRHMPRPPPGRVVSPGSKSPPVPFSNPQALSAFYSGPPPSSAGGLRPRAGTTSSHHGKGRPLSLALPSRSASAAIVPTFKDSGSNLKAGSSEKEKRRSSTSVKRLSFQEFTQRLSSTSSLLLVQTNASSSSGRGSHRTSNDYGTESEDHVSHHSEKESRDEHKHWRSSRVFGNEGGFL